MNIQNLIDRFLSRGTRDKKPDLRTALLGIAVVFLIAGGLMYAVAKIQAPAPQPVIHTGGEGSSSVHKGGKEQVAFLNADQTSIRVGETTGLTFQLRDEVIIDNTEISWSSDDPTIASVSESGEVTGVAEGKAEITGSFEDNSASVSIVVQAADEKHTGLDPVPLSVIESLPDRIDCDETDSRKVVQGVEWNTDTMQTFYVCYASYITAYNSDGSYRSESNRLDGEYLLFGIDYYDNKVFCVFRSSSFGKFKLRIYDAETLELLNSTDLSDLHAAFAEDKKEYESDLIPSIDGITIAPAIGDKDSLKIYISYNAYPNDESGIGIHDYQELFEYDYEDSIINTEEINADRRFRVELAGVKFGIQTLEYDRSTGNIWCAIRQGLCNYSLYCISTEYNGKTLKLVPNNGDDGWNCYYAGDGFCSLGNDWYSVLNNQGSYVEVLQVSVDDLEYIE